MWLIVVGGGGGPRREMVSRFFGHWLTDCHFCRMLHYNVDLHGEPKYDGDVIHTYTYLLNASAISDHSSSPRE